MTKQEAIGASQTANVKSVLTVRATAKNGPGVKRKLYIGLMKFLMGLSITITCGLVLFMIGYVLYRGVPNISWKLVSTSPSYLDDNIGILPDILNTLYIVIATLVIVLPLGVRQEFTRDAVELLGYDKPEYCRTMEEVENSTSQIVLTNY